jgi:Chaperonin 10 Kd subunit
MPTYPMVPMPSRWTKEECDSFWGNEERTDMKLQPLGDKIVVERLEPESKTPGGILLPDSAKERPKQGKVLAVGVGKQLDNGDVRKMDL